MHATRDSELHLDLDLDLDLDDVYLVLESNDFKSHSGGLALSSFRE